MTRWSDPETILQITGWLEAAGLASILIEEGDLRLEIRVGGAATVDRAADTPVGAPLAGYLLAAHPSRTAAPETVVAGEAGAFLRVGPVLVAVPAPVAGRIVSRAQDAVPAGFGDIAYALDAR